MFGFALFKGLFWGSVRSEANTNAIAHIKVWMLAKTMNTFHMGNENFFLNF